MTFAEKLKSIRKKAGLSQEQLAEKLGVSRQAVTKWETETGIPDIENMMAISALFDISIDELLSNERGMKKSDEYLFESVTEYDIDEPKRYDMKFGGAKQFVLSGYEGEKIRVRLVSNTLSTLQNDFKVKIDDIRKRIDVDVIRKNGISEATAKETVNIFVQIPMPYVGKIESAVNAETVEIRSLDCDSIELDVKTPNIIINDVGGTVEINCNLDMSVVCNSLKGYLAINQVSATSKIHIPEGEVFTAVTKGIGTSISYEKDGRQTERFDTPDAENVIELNGIKVSLLFATIKTKECKKNNLEKIQKTMKVFQTLTKIVLVFSFVAIAFTLVAGSVSLMADKLPFGELLQRLLIEADRTIDNREIGIALLCESVVLIFGAIEAICVCRYFKLELSEGTPFTETGAKSITKLGILFIVVDILSAAFSSAMEKFAFFSEGIDNGGGIGIGICLILLAMVVRYGAELEQRGRAK